MASDANGTETTEAAFGAWCVVELLGHRRFCGWVTEVQLFGAHMGRVDVALDPPVTHYFGGGSVYCITPTTEEIARRLATQDNPWGSRPSMIPAHASADTDERYRERYADEHAEDDHECPF